MIAYLRERDDDEDNDEDDNALDDDDKRTLGFFFGYLCFQYDVGLNKISIEGNMIRTTGIVYYIG